jgi:hypothetical protein
VSDNKPTLDPALPADRADDLVMRVKVVIDEWRADHGIAVVSDDIILGEVISTLQLARDEMRRRARFSRAQKRCSG